MTESSSSSDDGNGIISRVKNSAVQQLTSQKDRAADGVGTVTQALRHSTAQLRDDQHETIAQYLEQAADQIDRWTTTIREKDVTEVLDDVQSLARRQPAVFIGSAFALGLLGARFLKSSRDATRHRSYSATRSTSAAWDQSSRSRYGGSAAISEAADAPSTTGGVSVSDAAASATARAAGARGRKTAPASQPPPSGRAKS